MSIRAPQPDSPDGPEEPRGRRPRLAEHVHLTSLSYRNTNNRTVRVTPSAEIGDKIRPCLPVRRIGEHADTRNTPGQYYSHTDDDLLQYETHLESRWLLLLDFDPDIVYIATQPITIDAYDIDGELRAIPDIYAETSNGERILIDPHHPALRDQEAQVRRARIVAATCERLGWTYYRVTLPPPVAEANLQLLYDYSRPDGYGPVRKDILTRVSTPITLRHLWDSFDRHPLAIAGSYHLLWTRELCFDPNVNLSHDTLIWKPSPLHTRPVVRPWAPPQASDRHPETVMTRTTSQGIGHRLVDHWPHLNIGDTLRRANADYRIVGLTSLPESNHVLVFRLRCVENGNPEVALVPDVQADLVAFREPETLDEDAALFGTAAWAAADSPNTRLAYLGNPFTSASLGSDSEGRDRPTLWGNAGRPDISRWGWGGWTHVPAASTQSAGPDDPETDDDGEEAGTPSATEPDEPGYVVAGRRRNVALRLDVEAQLEGLPASALAEAREKEEHVLEVLTGFRSGDAERARPGEPRPEYTDSKLKNRLRAKAREITTTDRTVRRWIDRYEEATSDGGIVGLYGLVDKNSLRDVNPLAGIDARIIDAAFAQAKITAVDYSHGDAGRFLAYLQKRLDREWGVGIVPLPPRTTLVPKLKLILPAHIFGTGKQSQNADRAPARTFHPLHAWRPGQSVLMDATPLDILAWDPVNKIDVSVSLSATLDVSCHSLPSFRLVSGVEHRADATLLLAGCLRPEPMRPGWRRNLAARLLAIPEEAAIDWDARYAGATSLPVIYPVRLTVDHAKITHSNDFDRFCRELRITKSDARKLQPTDKRQIERLFKTIGSGFNQFVAGFKGNSVANRGKNVAGQARWTIEELEEFLAYWVVHIYQNTPSKALPYPSDPSKFMSPNEAYANLVKIYGWVPAPVADDMYFKALPLHFGELTRAGIQVDYRTYDGSIARMYDDGTPSPYLPPLTVKGRRRGRREGERRKGNLVPIRIDPNDVTVAWFLAWRHGVWVPLAWLKAPDPDMPVSDLFYRQMREQMARNGRDNTLEDEIAKAIDEFYEMAGADEMWKAKNRRQASREAERSRAQRQDMAAHTATVEAETPINPVNLDEFTRLVQETSGPHDADAQADADDDDRLDPRSILPLRGLRNDTTHPTDA